MDLNNHKSHDEAMDLIIGAAQMSTLSYEEAVAVYLRARGILDDGEITLGNPIPADWKPPREGSLGWIEDQLRQTADLCRRAR